MMDNSRLCFQPIISLYDICPKKKENKHAGKSVKYQNQSWKQLYTPQEFNCLDLIKKTVIKYICDLLGINYFIASLHKLVGKDNSIENKGNMVIETLRIVLLASSNDTPNTHNLKLEPTDHTF